MNALTKTAERRARSRKVYAGRRGPQGCVVWVITETANANPATRAGRSATTALLASNGGYGGSGPAQLALAILAEHLGDDHAALNLYQAFKWACIAQIRDSSWALSGEEVDNCLARLMEQQEAT